MISVEKGRATTVRTEHEEDALIESLVAGLDPEELAAVKAIIGQFGEGDDELYDLMKDSQYRVEPVSMEEFLDSDYFMGISAQTLYPQLREDLIRLFDDGSYSEVVLAGSIGWGKTTFAAYLLARILYEVSCLKEPQLAYGLSPGSEIHMTLLSKNMSLARNVLLSALEEKLKLSPFFQDEYPYHKGKDMLVFPRNVRVVVASVGSERVLGLNVFSSLMDEVNFMTTGTKRTVMHTAVGSRTGVEAYDLAEKVYATLDRRIKSRFMRNGKVPGMNVLISSKTTKSSFTERRVRAARFDPSVLVLDYATWQVKPKNQFSGETFRVLVGGATARSRILHDEEEVDEDAMAEMDAYVIDVPAEYRKDFELNLNDSIRDIAGLSTDAISAFISRQEKIADCVDPELFHPFTAEEWTFGTSGGFLWGKICNTYERRLKGGFKEVAWKPKRRPAAQRHVHIDTSLSGDATGICMGHVIRWVEVVRRGPDGEQYTDMAPEVEIDLMLRVLPPPGEYILLPEIRALVYSLIEHGFNVTTMTCDSYQSVEMIQQMRAHGVSAKVESVDTSMAPYEKLRLAIYEDRLKMYAYQPLLEELVTLEYDRTRGKVDHPPGGTKDVSDALAGVMEGLSAQSMRTALPFTVGADDAPADKDLDGTWVLTGRARPVEDPGGGAVPMPFLKG